MESEDILRLKDLSVSFYTDEGETEAVRGVSLTVKKGEILAIVGESGSGKTVLCKSIPGLLPDYAKIKSGSIELGGRELTGLPEKELRKIRGRDISMIFQDPLETLNPTIPVGKQVASCILKHEKVTRAQAREKTIRLLDQVGIEEPRQRYKLQPCFFSGGMRQRCVIAAALAGNPSLLLSDEATTALDATVESKILDLLLQIRDSTGIAMIFVSHDLGAVARVADRVAVMYAGRIVEIGTAEEIFYHPRHPYTWGLLSSHPSYALQSGELRYIPGMPPSLIGLPPGDAFAPRNPYALKIDYKQAPPMFRLSDTHYAASWLLDERAPHVQPPAFYRSGEAK